MMLSHADQNLVHTDGHITLAFKPTSAQIKAFASTSPTPGAVVVGGSVAGDGAVGAVCADAVSGGTSVGGARNSDHMRIPLTALVTVRLSVNTNKNKNEKVSGGGSVKPL